MSPESFFHVHYLLLLTHSTNITTTIPKILLDSKCLVLTSKSVDFGTELVALFLEHGTFVSLKGYLVFVVILRNVNLFHAHPKLSCKQFIMIPNILSQRSNPVDLILLHLFENGFVLSQKFDFLYGVGLSHFVDQIQMFQHVQQKCL